MPNLPGQEEIARNEHIGPGLTGDNIDAKRVASYVWNGTSWQVATTPAASHPKTPSTTSVANTITSTTLLSSNASRLEAEFYNASTAILYLLKGSGTASSSNYTVQMNQGDYYVTDYTGQINGVWASAPGGSVFITEST